MSSRKISGSQVNPDRGNSNIEFQKFSFETATALVKYLNDECFNKNIKIRVNGIDINCECLFNANLDRNKIIVKDLRESKHKTAGEIKFPDSGLLKVQIYCNGQRLKQPEYIEDTPKPKEMIPEKRSIAEQIALPSPKPEEKTKESKTYYLKGGDRRELKSQCAQVSRRLNGQNIVINFNDNRIGNKKFSIQDFDRVVLSPQKGNQQSALQFFEKDQINSSFTYLLQNDSRISISPNPNGNEEKDKNLITRFSFENFPETFQEIQKKLFQYMIPPFSNPGDDFSKYPNVIFKIYPKGNNEHYKFRCKSLDDFRPYRNTLVISYIRNGQTKQYSIGFNKNSNYKIEVAVFKKPE